MKTRMLNSSALLLPGLMFFALLVSCRGEEMLTVKRNVFYETATQKSFNLEDQTQINELITMLAKEKTEIKIMENAEVVDLTDNQGDFKAISVQYQAGDRRVKMVVPIVASLRENGQNFYTLSEENCNMKCTAFAPYTECNLEIIERCKTLNGSFIGKGEVSTSVAFNDAVLKNTILRAHQLTTK